VEPDGPASLANQAIKDQAPQISAGCAGEAPSRRPGGRAQITDLCCNSLELIAASGNTDRRVRARPSHVGSGAM
jgi:hypothetical protein